MVASGNWRIVGFSEHDAAANMAVDEAILESHLQKMVPPTLRIYRFNPPAMSVGRNQHVPPEVVARVLAKGFDIVRRPTGGRAVLHAGELTYSFVASSDDGILGTSVDQAYRQICRGLQCALESVGVNLQLGNAHAPYRQLQDCFHATTGSDLHVNGVKMIGSAQLRRRGVVLQHGSILLDQRPDLMPELLGLGGAEAGGHRANLFEICGRTFETLELQEALKHGFEKAFTARFEQSELSAYERRLTEQLLPSYRQFDVHAGHHRGTAISV
jgi:lipoate-protein ligase A